MSGRVWGLLPPAWGWSELVLRARELGTGAGAVVSYALSFEVLAHIISCTYKNNSCLPLILFPLPLCRRSPVRQIGVSLSEGNKSEFMYLTRYRAGTQVNQPRQQQF